MLYITFTISSQESFTAFQVLYQHMVAVRQANFVFDEETKDERDIEIDWSQLSEEETERPVEKLLEANSQDKHELARAAKQKRYQQLIPAKANHYLSAYVGDKQENIFSDFKADLMDYIESTFEAAMDKLLQLNPQTGVISFSALSHPCGGIDRLLIILRSFGPTPSECFDGFKVCQIEWTSAFSYTQTALDDKTTDYLHRMGK